MNHDSFYAQLFQPVRERIGPIDETPIVPFVGFDRGGKVRLSTIGHGREQFVTYITSELAVRDEQLPAKIGNYEFLITCDDLQWARDVLTEIGRMSLKTAFGHGHALDIGQAIEPAFPMQGLVVEEFVRIPIDGRPYGIYRIHGITCKELKFAEKFGTSRLLRLMEHEGVLPQTSIHRIKSILMEADLPEPYS